MTTTTMVMATIEVAMRIPTSTITIVTMIFMTTAMDLDLEAGAVVDPIGWVCDTKLFKSGVIVSLFDLCNLS